MTKRSGKCYVVRPCGYSVNREKVRRAKIEELDALAFDRLFAYRATNETIAPVDADDSFVTARDRPAHDATTLVALRETISTIAFWIVAVNEWITEHPLEFVRRVSMAFAFAALVACAWERSATSLAIFAAMFWFYAISSRFDLEEAFLDDDADDDADDDEYRRFSDDVDADDSEWIRIDPGSIGEKVGDPVSVAFDEAPSAIGRGAAV